MKFWRPSQNEVIECLIRIGGFELVDIPDRKPWGDAKLHFDETAKWIKSKDGFFVQVGESKICCFNSRGKEHFQLGAGYSGNTLQDYASLVTDGEQLFTLTAYKTRW